MNMIQVKTNSGSKQFRALLCLFLASLFFSCKKSKIEPVDVYPDPPAALVKFLDGKPSPAQGAEGSVVIFNVNGLKDKLDKFEFFINQTKAEVLETAENTVTVKVPLGASTGGSSVLINGEYYFGPTFIVRGKISIDPVFNTDAYRSNGPIYEMSVFGDSYLISGSFTNYQDQATTTIIVPGMAKLDMSSLAFKGAGATASQFNVGKEGINGPVTTVVPVENGKYLVAGSFSKYDTISNINSITRINPDGTVDAMTVDVIGEAPRDKAVVPAFNGGVTGNAGKVFYNEDTKETTLIGNFFSHVSTFYERSTIDGPLLDHVNAKQLIRMKENGSYDSAFNYNPVTNSSYAGANGFIYDAIKLDNGNIIAVGNFTSFHGQSANYIVRINGADGSVDQSFLAGSGTDGAINRIIQNATTGNILLTGNFKKYNGQPVNGVVMINENGELNTSFTLAAIDGVPNFAGQLSDGKIIVSGSFNKYGAVVRVGMAILNPDGSLAPGYNNMGLFRGVVNNFVETTTSTGVPGVILYGDFDRFDNREVGNIVKFRMEN